ncbi:class I mannose-6-phosphate isomerase [Streptomyces sp. NBC_01285]|uniref:class I mannose-6-phosphate isomerase n=1 Tax=Streptomyces sp. NBC_01285 TaxID=2903813 RepID=UPI00224D9740|nr:class I mannose-6-phosphate isomerase [Streptomyces sp. NBC_01285]MCX4775259.1 class I mannose-6-phosphate isomerase [Streptomyces sp. NBC_01285]
MTRSYDPNPRYPAVNGTVSPGWSAAVDALAAGPLVLAIDGPAALDWTAAARDLTAALTARGRAVHCLDLRTHEADWDTVLERTGDAPDAPHADRYYLPLAQAPLSDIYRELPRVERPSTGVLIVHGPGAALVTHDVLWYADLPKRHAEAAMAAGDMPVGVNLGRHREAGDLRRLFYADWPMTDAHRDALAPRIDRWLDLQNPASPASIGGTTLRATLAELARVPVRTRPYFNSTPWGGQWAVRELGFEPAGGNTALGYELIAPEAGVLVGDSAEAQVELPFQLLCVLHPEEFLGRSVHARFGTSFPIRYDYLDTVDGGSLSLHVHPREEYMRERFGWPYTQHETYYVTAHAGEDPRVYLGLQQNADLPLMRKQVERAIERGEEMDVSRFVQSHPSEEGRLYMIPAGTPHSSGAGNLVLEISATPYLYSLRFYDWLRKDAEGNSRPLPCEHGFANLDTRRQGADVIRDLVQDPRTLRESNGWREEVLGQLDEMFYEVRRLVIEPGAVGAWDDTEGKFHILNVSAGAGVVIDTADGRTHDLAFAETLTVPAALGAYRIRPLGDRTVHLIKSLVS